MLFLMPTHCVLGACFYDVNASEVTMQLAYKTKIPFSWGYSRSGSDFMLDVSYKYKRRDCLFNQLVILLIELASGWILQTRTPLM